MQFVDDGLRRHFAVEDSNEAALGSDDELSIVLCRP
jgi:hypothetical protein